MKKRILSLMFSITILCTMTALSTISAKAEDETAVIVDGSYLIDGDSSTGCSSTKTKGQYLMTGDCSISRAGLTRVYAYASTTANQEVNYMATLVFVDQLIEVDGEKAWGQVYGWAEESKNDYYMSTSQSVTVDRGYYYRVRARHIAGDEYPYEETASVTDGIKVP